MSKPIKQTLKTISLHLGDIPQEAYDMATRTGLVAWDIETSGLNWKEDLISTCQVYIPGIQIYIVRVNETRPTYLGSILSSPNIRKVFHHAMFDLRFMVNKWQIPICNIACTKIASKVLKPEISHTLKNLLSEFLDITIDKSLQTSNWMTNELSEQQIEYAAKDVLYLPQLLEKLEAELGNKNLMQLVKSCYDFIPTQIQLDIKGYKDMFSY
jgi:ribonuclease D